MPTAWEYREVSAYASLSELGTPEHVSAAISKQWLSTLNELGAEGWELVSEIHKGPRDRGEMYWSARHGTMKRPRQS